MFFGNWRNAKSPFKQKWVDHVNEETLKKMHDALATEEARLALEIRGREDRMVVLQAQRKLLASLIEGMAKSAEELTD